MEVKKISKSLTSERNNQYVRFDNGDYSLFISMINGGTVFLEKGIIKNDIVLMSLLKNLNFFDDIDYRNNHDIEASTVTISIHVSNKCNLSCMYCFREENGESLNIKNCKTFIREVVKSNENASKYVVDLSGSGEPLLSIDLIIEISSFCRELSNSIFREITVILATNGTLLTEEIVDILQKNGVIFGVSIDAGKGSRNINRLDSIGNGTYKKVMRNVKRIKEKGFLGAAYTLTAQTKDLVSDIKSLYKFFPTIAIKPVRSNEKTISISTKNIKDIKSQFTKLYNFLLFESKNSRCNYLISLLDGDDYFGKYISRAFRSTIVDRRCDAGISRYSLSPDKKIYVCAAAVGIDDLEIGSLEKGINKEKVANIKEKLLDNDKCTSCFAKFLCGGEYLVNSYVRFNNISGVDIVLCELRRHLVKLAYLLVYNLQLNSQEVYDRCMGFCIEKEERYYTNPLIIEVAKFYQDVYTFNDIMRIHFEQKTLFGELLKGMKR